MIVISIYVCVCVYICDYIACLNIKTVTPKNLLSQIITFLKFRLIFKVISKSLHNFLSKFKLSLN